MDVGTFVTFFAFVLEVELAIDCFEVSALVLWLLLLLGIVVNWFLLLMLILILLSLLLLLISIRRRWHRITRGKTRRRHRSRWKYLGKRIRKGQ